MPDAKYYPDYWAEYCSLVRADGGKPELNWAIFASRYRAAGNFQRGDFFAMNAKSTRAYDVALKLLLCFSALESACVASGTKPYNYVLGDFPGYGDECRRLARKHLGGFSEEDFPLRAALKNAELKARLSMFFSGRSNDLMPLAMSLRHLFAHGHWTPSGSGTLSVGACNCLNLLNQSLLKKCDEILRKHVEELKASSRRGS